MPRCVGTTEPIEVSFDLEMYQTAVERGDEMGRLRQSFTKGQSNRWGFLGEELVSVWVDGKITNDYQYDVLTPLGTKLEVKTKKTTRLKPPLPHYESSVCDFNATQKCDAYVFVRVCTMFEQTNNPEHMKAWICGWVSKKEFQHRAKMFKKGDLDERNNYRVHADCWNIAIGDLHEVPSFDKEYI